VYKYPLDYVRRCCVSIDRIITIIGVDTHIWHGKENLINYCSDHRKTQKIAKQKRIKEMFVVSSDQILLLDEDNHIYCIPKEEWSKVQ